MKIALLTGGKDPHYARGLAGELAAKGVHIALVGSNEEMVRPGELGHHRVELHDLVGRLDPRASFVAKITRVVAYYVKLIRFAAATDAPLFHILWFRRFPLLERLFLISYLKLLRKKVVFTAHNVDDRARDGMTGGFAYRLSLRFLYRSADQIFVHTRAMKDELTRDFAIPDARVTVVPLGINDVIPIAPVTRVEAREQLGLDLEARVLLFFGNITAYKGLADLIRALAALVREDNRFTVVIAGPVKDRGSQAYWKDIERLIGSLGVSKHVVKEIRYIPNEEVGLFFAAADVLILPYRRVYQSGVLGLSYAQGLPVIAADVGAIREDIVEGETGLLFKVGDSSELAAAIKTYFASTLFEHLEVRRSRLKDHGAERFSWETNAARTYAVYEHLLR